MAREMNWGRGGLVVQRRKKDGRDEIWEGERMKSVLTVDSMADRQLRLERRSILCLETMSKAFPFSPSSTSFFLPMKQHLTTLSILAKINE